MEHGTNGARPRGRLGRLTEQEQLLVLRRRSGLTMADLEEELGCSRYWIWKMESGRAPADRLWAFWRKRKN